MENFLSNLFSNLIADAIIAIGVGIYITGSIEKKEKFKEKRRNIKVLKEMLLDEIRHNRKQLELMVENFPIPNLVYPALETTVWESIDKNFFFNELTTDEIKHVVSIYNRFKSINKIYYSMLDKVNWIEEGKKPIIKGKFMDGLIARCREASKYINKNFKL